MQDTTGQVILAVEKAGLTVAKEKIQTLPPWKYLGKRVTEQTVTPQPLQLRKNSKTQHEVQQAARRDSELALSTLMHFKPGLSPFV